MLRAECGFVGNAHGRKLLVAHGATIGVDIGLDRTWDETQQRAPKADVKGVGALIDTGAEECCIDQDLATRLKLPVIDRRVVCGVGSLEVDVCAAQIHIPRLRYTIRGRFAAVPLREHGHEQVVLIGRTLLRDFRLTYDGVSADVVIEYSDPRLGR